MIFRENRFPSRAIVLTLLWTGVLMFEIGTVTALPSTSNPFAVKEFKCAQECDETHLNNLRNGLFQCGKIEESSGPWEPCYLNCFGKFKRAIDQNKCFCEYCRTHYNHLGFCLGPGQDHIRKQDCKRLVCNGRANYFGPLCSPSPEMKKYMSQYS